MQGFFTPFAPTTAMKTMENKKIRKYIKRFLDLRWRKWFFHSPFFYNQWWNKHGNKAVL